MQREANAERLRDSEIDPRHYYRYEGRFIKQKSESERIAILPRVISADEQRGRVRPIGDARVFERYAITPLSSLTCRYLEVAAGASTDTQRLLPSFVGFVLQGSGTCLQDGEPVRFGAEDLVIVPPYTAVRWVADAGEDVRIWVPEVRLWHVLGLLALEQLEFRDAPDGTRPVRDSAGDVVGCTVPAGTLGLEADLEISVGADARRESVFAAHRSIDPVGSPADRYDWFLQRQAIENTLEREGPRVIRGADVAVESTRGGVLRYYVSHWTDVAARALDVMTIDIEPGGSSGALRRIGEELLLVLTGEGYDVQEGARYPWSKGDLISVPPMTAVQHFSTGDETARLVSVWPRQFAHEFLGGIEHLADASSWRG